MVVVNKPSTTVILATYNYPRALELALHGLACQTDPEFDVIVADDGSCPPADDVVRRMALPFRVDVVWQPDDGFRKPRAQNVASTRTDAELLVFLDGDCLPYGDLVEAYRRHHRRGEFMVGSVFDLDPWRTLQMTKEGVARRWHQVGLSPRQRARAMSVQLKNMALGRWQVTRPRIRGANFAVDASLFRAVDGYDERFCRYGREDSDLRNRMKNAGARGISLWHRAHVVHLARPVAPVRRDRTKAPRALYDDGKTLVRARIGLSSLRDERAASGVTESVEIVGASLDEGLRGQWRSLGQPASRRSPFEDAPFLTTKRFFRTLENE